MGWQMAKTERMGGYHLTGLLFESKFVPLVTVVWVKSTLSVNILFYI